MKEKLSTTPPAGRNRVSLKLKVQQGFSLLELSVVLVVIAILVGITVTGADVFRNAIGVRMYSDYIQGWTEVFNTYMSRSGGVLPGDTPNSPTGMVMGSLDTPLCDDDNGSLALSKAMLLYGIALPAGRGPSLASRYVYEDKNGFPHELNVCLVTTAWSVQTVQTGSVIAYVPTNKTVLRISGLTPELAGQLSTMIDGRVDAGLGNLREFSPTLYDTSQISHGWSVDATQDIAGGANPSVQTTEVTADLLLN